MGKLNSLANRGTGGKGRGSSHLQSFKINTNVPLKSSLRNPAVFQALKLLWAAKFSLTELAKSTETLPVTPARAPGEISDCPLVPSPPAARQETCTETLTAPLGAGIYSVLLGCPASYPACMLAGINLTLKQVTCCHGYIWQCILYSLRATNIVQPPKQLNKENLVITSTLKCSF